jgi:hypothetical protein
VRVISRRVLNRTLLRRQHLLERVEMPALDMVEHLLGLQAQDVLPPYLSLWSRLRDFDPAELSTALERRTAVRVLLMRGTIHLVTAADALALRPLVQDMLDKVSRNSPTSRPAADVPAADLLAAGREVLAAGPMAWKPFGAALEERFPGYPAVALANRVREMTPLVQVPPRGLWRRSGGVVYALAEDWLGAEGQPAPEPADAVRRYLRAFGPATPADVSAWSGMTGVRAVFDSLGDELVRLRDEDGKTLWDLEGLELADEDTPAPVRLLGKYDNLWLSHADKTRTATPESRRRWMGLNGGAGATVFVDGMLRGLWRVTDGGKVELELFGDLSRADRTALDDEVARVEVFLAG